MNSVQTPEELGKLIRRYRKEQKLTQEEVALMANVGRRFIVDLEKGKHTLHLGKIIQVMQALGIGLAVIALWSDKNE